MKTLILGDPGVKAKKATYAVTVNTLRHLPILSAVLERTGLLAANPRLVEAAALVLCYEVLYGEGIRPRGGAERAVIRRRADLEEAAAAVLGEAGAATADAFLSGGAGGGAAARPRYVRVNTLKCSVESAVRQLADELGAGEREPPRPSTPRAPPSADRLRPPSPRTPPPAVDPARR